MTYLILMKVEVKIVSLSLFIPQVHPDLELFLQDPLMHHGREYILSCRLLSFVESAARLLVRSRSQTTAAELVDSLLCHYQVLDESNV